MLALIKSPKALSSEISNSLLPDPSWVRREAVEKEKKSMINGFVGWNEEEDWERGGKKERV